MNWILLFAGLSIAGLSLFNGHIQAIRERFNYWAADHLGLFILGCFGLVVLVVWGLS